MNGGVFESKSKKWAAPPDELPSVGGDPAAARQNNGPEPPGSGVTGGVKGGEKGGDVTVSSRGVWASMSSTFGFHPGFATSPPASHARGDAVLNTSAAGAANRLGLPPEATNFAAVVARRSFARGGGASSASPSPSIFPRGSVTGSSKSSFELVTIIVVA